MKPAPKNFCSCKSLSFHGLSILVVSFLISACATPPKQSGVAVTGSAHPQVARRDSAGAEIEKRLRAEYRHWQGTRHRLGGTGSRGIDCSGFVKAVYKDIFNIDLPRTTRAQVRQGQPVSFEKLRAGDLIFFKPPSYPRHVGIYLGGFEFVHASKNNGVTLSKIDKYYWRKYYWTARRILPASKQP
jgi:cell wall-associated NlpC family hydrolase